MILTLPTSVTLTASLIVQVQVHGEKVKRGKSGQTRVRPKI